MSKVNLWQETLKCLRSNLESFEVLQVQMHRERWCQRTRTSYFSVQCMTWEQFEAEARCFDYDNGHGAHVVPMGLKIIGDGWWLERGEYDGAEWWEFKRCPDVVADGESFTLLGRR